TLSKDGAADRVQYHHPDRLGTRLVTHAADTGGFEQVSLPFGTALAAESTGASNRRFTSYERSALTGLDYAVNRHYDSALGRFGQVDPMGMSAARLRNPQSLNLYSYVGNDPVNRTDALGLDDDDFKLYADEEPPGDGTGPGGTPRKQAYEEIVVNGHRRIPLWNFSWFGIPLGPRAAMPTSSDGGVGGDAGADAGGKQSQNKGGSTTFSAAAVMGAPAAAMSLEAGGSISLSTILEGVSSGLATASAPVLVALGVLLYPGTANAPG